jgi:urease accessory protein
MMKMRTIVRFGLVSGLAALAATPALAHTGRELHTHGFAAGLAHPFGGLDHILAMVAVGIWSASLAAGRQVFVVPAAFVAAMLAGAGLAHAGVGLFAAETVIATSVVVLGMLILARVNLSVWVGATLVALFAVFHGYAHGLEAAGTIAPYMAGFAITTAALHLAGIVLGKAIAIVPLAPRLLGAGIVASGAYLIATL